MLFFFYKMQRWQEESIPFIIILFVKFKKSWRSGLFWGFLQECLEKWLLCDVWLSP